MFRKWATWFIVSSGLVGGTVTPALAAMDIAPSVFAYTYADAAGGKGKDSIKLPAPPISGGGCAVFEDAKVIYEKRRYGQVDIIDKPKQSCNPAKSQCSLDVAWEHAPGGRLIYKVEVSWKMVAGC